MIRRESTWNKDGAPADSAWNVGKLQAKVFRFPDTEGLPDMVILIRSPLANTFSRFSS